jgi:hypothetical protein
MACLVGRTIEALIRLLACVFPVRVLPCLGEARISVVTVAGPLLLWFAGSGQAERWSLIGVIHEQLQQLDQNLERLMGGELDATKTISSLILFEAAGLTSATTLLDHLGRRCACVQAQLNAEEG